MRKPALLFALSLLLLIANGCSIPVWTSGEVPFVPTPIDVIDRMLEMAQVKSGDVIYDIGSGDGRIIIQAAKKYGVRGVGIEIDPDLVQKAGDNAFREKVDHLVEFRAQDAFTADVSHHTIFLFEIAPRTVELSVYPRIRRVGRENSRGRIPHAAEKPTLAGRQHAVRPIKQRIYGTQIRGQTHCNFRWHQYRAPAS